ncbi:MAG: RluA family pseudouridine synthase [Deltaproteobacteria bacterium]|nr:RluA family pseudouridine synthase [Deltaproteobacteria bacterium]
MEAVELVVPAEAAGERLDRYLAAQGLPLSRSQLQGLIAEGQVLIGGRRAKPGHRLRAGDRVSALLPEPRPLALEPEPLPLTILYEDADLVVLDKPAGLVVHPAPGHPTHTLVHALLAHCRDLSGIGGVLRPGIVHRLDRDTSGVLVVAKHDRAHSGLAAQFKAHTARRRYQAIVHSVPDQDAGRLATTVGRHPTQRKRMAAGVSGGREAATRWRVLRRFTEHSLLELQPETGRTHQLRVHLSHLGHPVVGDPVYGRRRGRLPAPIARQALHACLLGFTHPVTGAWMEFTAPLPADMEGLLKALEQGGDEPRSSPASTLSRPEEAPAPGHSSPRRAGRRDGGRR